MNPKRSIVMALSGSLVLLSPAAGGEPTEDALESKSVAELAAMARGSDWEWAHDPASDEWAETELSKELKRRCCLGLLTDEDWKLLLVETGAIATRKRWMAGDEFAVATRCPWWMGGGGWAFSIADLRVTPRLEDAQQAHSRSLQGGCGVWNDGERRREAYQVVGRIPDGIEWMELDVEAKGSRGCDYQWTGTITVPIELVESPEELLERVADPALDAAVRRSLSIHIDTNRGTPARTNALVLAELDPALHEAVESVSFKLRVELIRDGQVEATGGMDLNLDFLARGAGAYTPIDGPKGVLRTARTDPSKWTVRVSPEYSWALLDLRRNRVWDGTFEAPLSEVLEPPTRAPDGE